MEFTMKAKVLAVESVELHFTEGENPAMVIGAQGIAPSFGWKNGELVPWVYINPPEDGIWDFDFIADAPVGISLPVVSYISTEPFMLETPSWLKGIRVHASTNALTSEINESLLSQERVQFLVSDFRMQSEEPLPRDFEPRWPPKPMPWPLPFPKFPLPDLLKPDLLKMPISSIKGRPVRVFTEGDAITKEHIANRINFVLDKINGYVKEIYLG